MKIAFLISLLLGISCEINDDDINWKYAEKKWLEADRIESSITGASIPEREVNVLDYNIFQNGEKLNTGAINDLIMLVSAKGGGKIIFPPGVYLTGGIILKDNVGIHLEKEAVIKFSQNPI